MPKSVSADWATILRPFFSAPIQTDRGSIADTLKSNLSDTAQKLGYREGKEGVAVPPSEWSGDNDIQILLRRAWVRGCESGLLVRATANDQSSPTP